MILKLVDDYEQFKEDETQLSQSVFLFVTDVVFVYHLN